jgi:acyl-homoserine lactone acylase PvdQ
MVSEEGLNAYGAVTWGQFFIYQGFNEHCGWMHTSSDVDAADSYIEKLSKTAKGWVYKYDGKRKPVIQKRITIKAKKKNGFETVSINVFFTHHGPIMAKKNGQWISVKADNRIINGLVQCWQRTKAKSFEEFRRTLDLKGNISNNTVYADAEGNIAYWHGNRIPKRDPGYDWSKPVDGSISLTEWKGYHNINETVYSINPANGWLQNCNSTPFNAAGNNSPKREKYPSYMAPDGETFRGINAVRVLSEENKYTIDKVIKAGYDGRLASFEVLVPALLRAFAQNVHGNDTLYNRLYEAIGILRNWDFRCDESSIATTLAIEWGKMISEDLSRSAGADQVERAKNFAASANANDLLLPLVAAINDLNTRFGNWKISWGEINRFQRISSNIENKFDDNMPSIPVGYASSTWGMLPSFVSRTFAGTKKRYGYNGNSFVCAVEFGERIKAKSLLTGGQSGDPNSKHFTDQAMMYSKGEFKDVLFYKDDVMKHVEKTYHPGE